MEALEGLLRQFLLLTSLLLTANFITLLLTGERGGSVVECRTPEREVRGSRPTAAVLCPWARHFTPRKYWLITQEAMAPSRHDWKIVDWDVKPQHNQNLLLTEQKNKIKITRLGCLLYRRSLALIIGPIQVRWANTPIRKHIIPQEAGLVSREPIN